MGLAANDVVEFTVGEHRFRTRVLRCLGRDLYLDALPEIESEWTPAPGSNITMVWFEDEFRWSQEARVVDVLDPLQIVLVRVEGESRRTEQRSVVRVKVSVPLEYGLPRQKSLLMTTTLDLSASGLRFPSAFRVWKGLNLRLGLRLGLEVVTLTGVVMRFVPKELRGRLQWETAVRFVSPTPTQQKILESYVERELQRAKRGERQ